MSLEKISHPPPVYPNDVLRRLPELTEGCLQLDALNVELSPSAEIAPTVAAWAVGIDANKVIVAALLTVARGGSRCFLAVHQGDRLTAGKWLRENGVPVVRLGTLQAKGSSSIRFNPHFGAPENV